MKIRVRDDSKIVEVWLTREEKEDEALRESLKPLYQQYKEQKYLVSVFLSGEEDLYPLTLDLLRSNRRQGARRELEGGEEMESVALGF